MRQDSFSLRLSAFNAFLFMGGGIQMPFMPLWLKDKGLSASQIAIVMAAMMGVRILATPAGSFLADRYGNRRRLISIAAGSAFLCYCLLAPMQSFPAILATAIAAAALFAPVATLAEVFALEGSAHHGLDYGRIRVWSSLSFLMGSLFAGAMLDVISVWWVIYLIIAAQGIGAAMSFILPPDPVRRSLSKGPVGLSRIGRVVMRGPFLIFLLAVSLGQASHGLFYAFGSVIWDHVGYGKATIGALWATGVLAEVTFFAVSARAVRRFRPAQLIVAGIAGGLLRWVIFAFNPPLWLLFPAQALHASSFALTHLGTMHYIQQNTPAGVRNTVQGIYTALSSGVLLSAVMWASGPLYGSFGGTAYFIMAAISALALGLGLVLLRVSPTAPTAADA
jgi:MFS transporter, PPP family, 3-phenylpropionic acid transporter